MNPARLRTPLLALAVSLTAWLAPGQDGGDAPRATRPPADDQAGQITIPLRPADPSGRGIGWSPKGATVPLVAGDATDGEGPATLTGRFELGPDGSAPVRVELRRSEGATAFDRLAVDADRNGAFSADEVLTTTPSERRGKIWSSFTASLSLPTTAPDGDPVTLSYPVALWYVEDPTEPDAPKALRWSRRGWMEGHADTPAGALHLALAESVMDGVFDARDRWAVGASAAETRGSRAFRGGDDHAWRGEQAWRLVEVHPSGLQVTLRPFDPGMTRAEEEAARDRYAADRRAPRAASPVPFAHDFEKAEAAAKAAGKPLFLDFETTWCGPCKQMDAMVYTAKAVVDAATQVVPVKIDGDEHKDLTERFAVTAYPTMILLAPDGTEIRRAVGYRGVADMTAFLAAPKRGDG